MRMKTVVKLGTVVSVTFFCIAVGYYALMRFDKSTHNRDVDFFTLIPQTAACVLECDNINAFFNELPMLNYNREMEKLQHSNLFGFLLNVLNEYTTTKGHGLSSEMSRMAVSFHAPFSSNDQVVYWGLGSADEKMLEDMLQEYSSSNFLPKEEKYRGKDIVIYPLGVEEYLASYSESGYLVVSLQKHLIEQVIDAKLDETSLSTDAVFPSTSSQKKANHLTIYSRSSVMPFLKSCDGGWSEFDFYTNSDVLYLTGETYLPEACDLHYIQEKRTFYEEEKLFFSTEKDSVALYIDKVYDEEIYNRTFFNQCLANLSKEAIYTLVADMEYVSGDSILLQGCLPDFLLENASLFSSFVFSAQYSLTDANRLSHIWVFTYKD